MIVFAFYDIISHKQAPTETPAAEEPAAAGETPLVVGYSPFSSKFSPFFAETAYDQDAQSLTQIPLLSMDRMGAVIYYDSQCFG